MLSLRCSKPQYMLKKDIEVLTEDGRVFRLQEDQPIQIDKLDDNSLIIGSKLRIIAKSIAEVLCTVLECTSFSLVESDDEAPDVQSNPENSVVDLDLLLLRSSLLENPVSNPLTISSMRVIQ
jgi:hypothetical protein